jgi:hypothetical protein
MFSKNGVFKMKNKWILVSGVFFLFCIGCVSFTGNVSEIPPQSLEPTPLEGVWYGVLNSIPYELEFRGNTFVSKAFASSSPNSTQTTDIWGKGVFTYTDNVITYYTLNSYNPQGALYSRWTKPQEGMKEGKTPKTTGKYSFSSGKLVVDKTQYSKRDEHIKMPDQFVFFYNANNFTLGHLEEVKNGEVFTIEKIDDRDLSKFSMPMFGSGYWSTEQREPGTHKITFRQNLKKTESGYYKTNKISGYFTTSFTPGVYRFFLYTDEHDTFMPDNLPQIPANTARIVIGKTNLDDGVERYYDYIDIPIN